MILISWEGNQRSRRKSLNQLNRLKMPTNPSHSIRLHLRVSPLSPHHQFRLLNPNLLLPNLNLNQTITIRRTTTLNNQTTASLNLKISMDSLSRITINPTTISPTTINPTTINLTTINHLMQVSISTASLRVNMACLVKAVPMAINSSTIPT